MTLYVNLSSGPGYENIPDEEDELIIPSAEVILVVCLFITDRVPPKKAWQKSEDKISIGEK